LITLTLTAADLLGTSVEDGPMGPCSDRLRRQSFTAQYKLDMLTEYDAANPAARGVLLRREGLYCSTGNCGCSCTPGSSGAKRISMSPVTRLALTAASPSAQQCLQPKRDAHRGDWNRPEVIK